MGVFKAHARWYGLLASVAATLRCFSHRRPLTDKVTRCPRSSMCWCGSHPLAAFDISRQHCQPSSAVNEPCSTWRNSDSARDFFCFGYSFTCYAFLHHVYSVYTITRSVDVRSINLFSLSHEDFALTTETAAVLRSKWCLFATSYNWI